MSGFKVEDSPAPGLCGTCRNAVVQVTQRNQMRVICSGGEPTFVVREPLDRCSMFSRKTPPNPSEQSWIIETGWWPVIVNTNGRRRKTFMEPDDPRLEEAVMTGFGAGWDSVLQIKARGQKIGVRE